MPKKHEAARVPQPALVPLHGIQDKKPHILDRDAIIIGRARGCDVGLDAPDVSNLHCVIARTAEGFRIRDCGSRSGTKLNGENTRTAILQDGDVLQLGQFSFTVKIPVTAGQVVNSVRAEHLQRSRRRLAERALKLRRKIANYQDMGISRPPTELARQASALKTQIHGYDERLSELELAERELVQDRDKLHKEKEAHQAHVEQVQHDISHRLELAEKEIHKRWQEFQQRCKQEENRLGSEPARPAPAKGQLNEAKLREQKEELDIFARELEEEREQLDRAQKQLDEELAVLRQQRLEISKMQEQLNGQQVRPDAGEPDRLQAGLAGVEASLNEQRQTLAYMMANLEKIQSALGGQSVNLPPQAGLSDGIRHDDALAEENAQLRERIAELEDKMAAHADERALNELCGDHDLLRELLKDEQAAGGPDRVSVEKLRAENECLANLLQSKEHEIETLRKEAKPVARGGLRESDLENYEAELNQYRRQLDEDRSKLSTEIEQLRQRNAELDETVRDMEMEMSRERAELARERTRLDRLREEVRVEMERLQRDGAVRESLASVQKLREEMKKQPANGVSDRLNGLRKSLTE